MSESRASSADLSAARWQSVFLYFSGELYGAAADRVLLGVVEPWARRWRGKSADSIDGFFFVRYSEDGNHIRLRFCGAGATAALTDLEAAAGASEWVERLSCIEYEPELERYGGEYGMEVVEQHFCRSSETALALLGKIDPEGRSQRLGKALLAQLVLFYLFASDRQQAAARAADFGHGYLRQRAPDPQQQQDWIQQYLKGYDRQANHLASYVEAAWSALGNDDELTPELDSFRDHTREERDQLELLAAAGKLRSGGGETDWEACRRWLLPSFLHMLNNRLGVDLREECYLAVLIHQTLAATSMDQQSPDSSDPQGDGQQSRSLAS